jgi:SAM-dependent methyltransferase
MTSNTDMVEYYARRAREYEQIYHKPERQADLLLLKAHLRQLLAGQHVLEVACGTGYWTAVLAETAASIVATDINTEVLDVARAKALGPAPVTLAQAEAGALDALPGEFTAGFAGFWWSHLSKQGDLQRFLAAFHARLGPGALVVFVDNRYVEGSSAPISRIDEHGNTYQLRTLSDGTLYEVLKNFPDEAELGHVLATSAHTMQYEWLTYYWLVAYRLRQ